MSSNIPIVLECSVDFQIQHLVLHIYLVELHRLWREKERFFPQQRPELQCLFLSFLLWIKFLGS